MSIFDQWFMHRCDVETLTATDAWGAQTAVPHTEVPCLVDNGGVQLAHDATGADTVSTMRLYVPLEFGGWFTPTSSVTVNGYVSEVVSTTEWSGDSDLNCAVVVLK